MDRIAGMVSVVIPYYNRRSCIGACLESVLNQTYRNLEVIVVDDGSAESAEDILAPYLGERVRYHRYTPNQGASHARNVGVTLARGEYIAFQDSDDLWKPNKLELQLEYLRSGGWDLVFCGMNRIGKLNGTVTYVPAAGFHEEKDAVEQLLHFDCVGTQLLFLKAETAQKLHFEETFRKFEDGDYVLQAALLGVRIGYLPAALVDSEVQEDSLTLNISGGPAREQVYSKHQGVYARYPKANARFLEDMARAFKTTDRKKSAGYLRQSMKAEFTLKRCVKYILTEMKLIQ